MRRTSKPRIGRALSLSLLAPACLLGSALPASAGPSVDPASLIPPLGGAVTGTCQLNGNWIICSTTVALEPLVNEPVFDLPCGTVYETSTDVRRGTRWYDSATRELDRRFVIQDFRGTWSLSPTGDGPTVTVTAHTNWRNDDLDPFAPEDTWPQVIHGNQLTIRSAGGGVISHIAGQDTSPDGDHHGRLLVTPDDPAFGDVVCAALTA